MRSDPVAAVRCAGAQETRRQASEERLRLARELHDALGHHLSLINLQAGVALHLDRELPVQARGALAAIKQASLDALGELRSLLDLLRQQPQPTPRAPTWTLARLDALVAQAHGVGLEVRTEIQGEVRVLPVGVGLAAFRLVQEALTNATPPCRADHRDGARRLRGPRPHRGGRRRRPPRQSAQPGRRRQGAAWHAGTGRRTGRRAPGRSPAGWGVPRAGPPAPERRPMTRTLTRRGPGSVRGGVPAAIADAMTKAHFRAPICSATAVTHP
jgi:hypothetical protein